VTHRSSARAASYPAFLKLDGSHPLKRAAPAAYVDYAVRRRRDGRVAWFNFALAREMGLIPHDHPDRLNPALRRAILDAFCLVIVNEHDLLRRRREERAELPQRYMATRYLQLQHPGRLGRTSGDGRSIWNGAIRHRGATWDVSSCGTGVTCLCPATAENKEFYRTGSRHASYGCGTAGLDEGLSTVLLSEIFHRNGIGTERVLALIALPQGCAINVRAGRNLLRPSHFFTHLKQADRESLQGVVDCFIERQVENGSWPALRGAARRYDFFAKELTRVFARSTALFESEYIFCWLDWDGDNILADGGVIDYGSVRQLGLYHREYRFDDGPRWSTTLPQQRTKARQLVRGFAQIRDFLRSGRKPPLGKLGRDPLLRLFDAEFAAERERRLLARVGFEPQAVAWLRRHARPALERFRRSHGYFERARAARGPCKVADGVSWNAIFCSRDLLRELPVRYAERPEPLPARELLEIAASSYASRRDRRLTAHRRRMAGALQSAYLELANRAASNAGISLCAQLTELARRSARINAATRTTGDGADYATARLLRQRRRLTSLRFHQVIEAFVASQDRSCDARPIEVAPRAPELQRLLGQMLRDVAHFRHGL
jgi:hypothetical protein